jgi:hypothetical protein
MPVLTKPQEIIRADFAGHAKLFSGHPDPLTGHALSFIVVIANTQVFLKSIPWRSSNCIGSWPSARESASQIPACILCKDYTKRPNEVASLIGMITNQSASPENSLLNGWHPHLLLRDLC